MVRTKVLENPYGSGPGLYRSPRNHLKGLMSEPAKRLTIR